MSHITTEDPATLRLPFKEKLSYGIGDLASNILLDIGTLYLLKFYTDVLGLPGTYGGIIFLISKFFTAFTDMGTGNHQKPQRTRLTGGMASGRRYAGPAAVHGGIRASYESYRR